MGGIPVFTLIRTDTTLDLSQKAEKRYFNTENALFMFPSRRNRDRIENFVGIVGELRNAIVSSAVDDAPPLDGEREPSSVNQLIIGYMIGIL